MILRRQKRFLMSFPSEREEKDGAVSSIFEIAVAEELEDGKKEVERGDIAYWPPGRALCLFWGPTPISSGGRIIPASEVTILSSPPCSQIIAQDFARLLTVLISLLET